MFTHAANAEYENIVDNNISSAICTPFFMNSHLFVAVGQPGQVAKARAYQLILLIIGLFLLGPRFGIAGVALAVNIMLLFGVSYLLWKAKRYVQFLVRAIFFIPVTAMIIGIVVI